jgi:hypothetical protein
MLLSTLCLFAKKKLDIYRFLSLLYLVHVCMCDSKFGLTCVRTQAGEIEFNGYELSRYVELLMKGYPKTVEVECVNDDLCDISSTHIHT